MRNLTNLCMVLAGSLFLASCGGGGGGGSTGGGGGSVSTPAPSVSINASSNSVTEGDPITLTWSSSNATSCTGSGSWSGSKGTSGSEEVSETSAGEYSYSLSCSGAGGSASASTSVTVERLIRIDADDTTYRVPDLGDLYVRTVEGTAESYSYGGALIETASVSYSVDEEIFSSTLSTAEQQVFTDIWETAVPLLKQSSNSEGDITFSNRVYYPEFEILVNSSESGVYYAYIDGTEVLGVIAKDRLIVGSSYSEEYASVNGDIVTVGTITLTTSNTEIIDTPLGKVEAFKVSVVDDSIDYDRRWVGESYGVQGGTKINRVDWIHPKIGTVASEANGQYDDTPTGTLFENEYYRIDANMVLSDVNFELPD